MPAHLQVYLDGELVHDYQGILDMVTQEYGHPVDNGETVPLKSVITLRLAQCPFGHGIDDEYCV